MNNCELTLPVTVNEPAQLVAESVLTQDYTCLQLGEITVGSVTPTTGGTGRLPVQLKRRNLDRSDYRQERSLRDLLTDGTYTVQSKGREQYRLYRKSS